MSYFKILDDSLQHPIPSIATRPPLRGGNLYFWGLKKLFTIPFFRAAFIQDENFCGQYK
jgi:hypothetical protein